METLTPGLVFAASGKAFSRAIEATVPQGIEIVVTADPGERPADTVRRTAGGEADQRGRPRARQGRARHHREIPFHLGLDRQSQGRHQHPAHAVFEPGDDPRDPCLHRGRAAGAGRLAALESHLRRQSRFRHGAAQRRLVLHRRGQAAAGRHRSHRAQPARDRADHLSQRAQGLRDAAAVSAHRRGIAAELLQPHEGAVLRGRRRGAARLGRIAGDGCRHDRRAHHLPVEPRLDGDSAGRARAHLGIRPARQYRRADARRGTEARPQRRQARRPLQGAEHHAGLLAASATSPRKPSTTKASTRWATRSGSRTRAIPARASCSTAASPKISSSRAAHG